tara:strand:+ start:2611 stop:3423 length:813 start_codon:yes stop_codon:yes gene_type:complete
MHELTKGVLSVKLLEVCGGDINSAVYSLAPIADEDIRLHTHSLHTLPLLINSSIEILTEKKTDVAKSAVYYKHLKKEQENVSKKFNDVCDLVNAKGVIKIKDDKTYAGLATISHLYFDSFISPIQFFLPHSSGCSGKWDFWDSIDFFKFKERLQDKKFNFGVREKILKSKTWNVKFNLSDFPVIVQRRLTKEKLLNKKLNPAAMIKAMIIKMGEMGRPFINYETVDFSIREFFTYLGEKKYLRVDREMEFLRRMDKEIITILKEDLEEQR